jgi:transcriptional regulator with XRE-family HTH domain
LLKWSRPFNYFWEAASNMGLFQSFFALIRGMGINIMGNTTDPTPVSELVDALFKTYHHPNGYEYSYQEISNTLNGELDQSYIAKVRKGIIKNPGRDALRLLCLFFHVPASYFFPELENLESAEQQQKPDGREAIRIALRTAGLTPEAQIHVEAIIEMLRPK